MVHSFFPDAVSPPKTVRKVSQRIDAQGRLRTDSYQWLEQRDSSEVLDWLKRENEYTERGMAGTKALQTLLYQEMKARLQEDDQSLPYSWHGYQFFSRTVAGKDYPIHYRRQQGMEQEEVLFDGNQRAGDEEYFDLGMMAVSPDNQLLAWAEDFAGNESWVLRIRNLGTNELLGDVLEGCSANIVWSQDSSGFWYIRLDKNFRPWQLCFHRLGDDPANDVVLFEERDERFFLSVYPDRSESLLILESASTDTSECFLGSLAGIETELQIVRPRQTGLEYYLDSDGEQLFIRTNDQGINYRLVTMPLPSQSRTPIDLSRKNQGHPLIEHPEQSMGVLDWRELVPHREDITLEDYELFPGRVVLFEREQGLVQVRILTLADGKVLTLDFPDQAWSVGGCDNAEFGAGFLRLEYESLNRPPSVYDVDLVSGALTLRRQMPVLGGFDPERYHTRRIMVPSHDGVDVPVSLVGRHESFTQPAPLLLYGYGAYGVSEDVYFSSGRLNLLERGVIFAIAHVRGGADLGERWYRDGRRLNKKNSFEDFIACARALIADQITAADRLVISGGSAGGLLMGAALNQAPELFAGAVLDVPFVDVLNTMFNPDLPLTVTEYDEWGDPAEQEVYEYIRSYSPVDNIVAQHYPPQLVMAGLEDRRVQYWEPAKWVAQMRALKTDNNPVFLKTHMGAGHFGASGRYAAMQEAAFEQAFILTVAGVAASE